MGLAKGASANILAMARLVVDAENGVKYDCKCDFYEVQTDNRSMIFASS